MFFCARLQKKNYFDHKQPTSQRKSDFSPNLDGKSILPTILTKEFGYINWKTATFIYLEVIKKGRLLLSYKSPHNVIL